MTGSAAAAEIIFWLLSAATSFVTGAILTASGGR
jgi:NAD(P)-dependent dehydrogenase (short-subunit alcohol dehydrogenase family)